MSFSKSLVSSKTALGVCLALGTLGSLPALANDINISSQQPAAVNQINPLQEGKKPSYSLKDKSTYIVRLSSPSIAAYNGGLSGMPGTSLKSTGANRLNTRSPAVATYRLSLIHI